MPALLHDLALDLRWSWRPDIRAMLRAIDPDRRLTGTEDPWAILRLVPADRLDEFASRRVRVGWRSIAFGTPAVRGRGARARLVVPVGLKSLTPVDVVVQLHRGRGADEEPGVALLEMRPSRRTGQGWTDYGVALDDLSAPLDAHTARALPRDAADGSRLAPPLIAWQR